MKPSDEEAGCLVSRGGRLYTRSAAPGIRVYGERLVSFEGVEYREWDPYRSKLSAYLRLGGGPLPFRKDDSVLYLGAASGTTASHVSDMVPEGRVYCVQFSPRTFRELVRNCDRRPNMIPILGDATRPEEYSFVVGSSGVVYSDVAQKRQTDILADNMDLFGADRGMVSIKARSEDVTAAPADIFSSSEARLRDRGFRIEDIHSLEPYEMSHAMIYVRRG